MMSEKSIKFKAELESLITQGETLLAAMNFECFRDDYNSEFSEDEIESFVKELPKFKSKYQAWYSEAQALVQQVLPNRLKDFESYFEYPRVRKEIDFQNYMIRDYLQGLTVTQGWEKGVVVDGKAAIPEFEQQLGIVRAARDVLGSSLVDLTAILQADLFDSEIDSARALAKLGFLRAAGAICGVVIEKHLQQICAAHGITIRKKHPTINDLIQPLRDIDTVSVPQWRFVQHLADTRNLCDHAKGKEPSKDEIEDLVTGTAKVLKTIF